MDDKNTEPLEKATVSAGRTLHLPSDQTRTGRSDHWAHAGPGQEVVLPRSEVKRLRSLGFLK